MIRDAARGGDGDAGMMSSSTSATQSHRFNFSPRGEIRHVSCVILISSASGHLPVSFYIQYARLQQLYPPAQVDINVSTPAAKLLEQGPNSDMPLTLCEICIISRIHG